MLKTTKIELKLLKIDNFKPSKFKNKPSTNQKLSLSSNYDNYMPCSENKKEITLKKNAKR